MLNCLSVVFWEIQHLQSCITLHGLSLCVLLRQAKPQVRSSGDICTTNMDKQFFCETSTHTDDSPRPPLPPFGLLLRLSRSFVFLTLASGPLGFSALFLLKLSRLPSFTRAALLRRESFFALRYFSPSHPMCRARFRCDDAPIINNGSVSPASTSLPLPPGWILTLGCVCRFLPTAASV